MRSEFEVFFQPQFRMKDRVLIGAEALLRWHHPVRGLLQPSAFITTLENTALAGPVGDWVLMSACHHGAEWNKVLPLQMGVNLFGAQFRSDRSLSRVVQDTLSLTLLAPSFLELEITENIMLLDDSSARAQLDQLSDMGVGLAFDDYGTGYASLAFLKQFPITRLKIDRGFITNMGSDSGDAAIVRAVIMLARRFGLAVIAEGVETNEQATLLRKWGCQAAQGYLYGKPVSASDFQMQHLSGQSAAPLERKKILKSGFR
jgi:EAL domain-containing protein (putative c-di-GMP-specific phosphodiesterase class I)